MNDEELTKLESKIYIFSVNVFSFIKTLMDENITNENTRELFSVSSKLYSEFVSLLDDTGSKKDKSSVYISCIAMANASAEHLSKIDVKGALLNERVDLLIEAKEIIRILEKSKIE